MNEPDQTTPNPRMSDEPAAVDSVWIASVDAAHRQALLRYAFHLCQDYPMAEDAVQETFVRLCREPRGKIEDRLVPWLFRVCRTRLIDALRKNGRTRPMEDLLEQNAPDTRTPDPARVAERTDTHQRVLAYMDRLPPAQREVVRLKFQHHLSYQEIADITEKTVNTVGVLLHTALTTLRRSLAADLEIGTVKGQQT